MRQDGLSLLELLASIVLMGIIAAFLSNAISLSTRVEKVTRKVSDTIEREATGVAALRRLFKEAEMPKRDRPETLFTGDAKQVSFAALIPRRLSGGGLLNLQVFCDKIGGVTVSWRNAKTDDRVSETRNQTLALWPEDPCEAISYFGQPDRTSRQSAQWHSQWPEEAMSLPSLIRFELAGQDSDARLVHIATLNRPLTSESVR